MSGAAAPVMLIAAARRPCPICAHVVSSVLHAQVFAPLGVGNDPTGYSLVACERCGFVYADVAAKQELIDDTYRLVGRPTERSYDLTRLQATADYISIHVGPQARVLDAGCGTGALLRYLRAHGFRQVTGLDPSPAAIERVHEHGFEGYVGSLSAPPDIGTFDVVVLAHVLEHVRDLDGALATVRNMLRPDGILYAEVPDAARYAAALYEPFHDVNTEHINHFSSNFLALLFQMRGFTLVDAGEKWVECAPATPYPATYGLWRVAANPACDVPGERDEALVISIEDYISASNTLLRHLAFRLAEALDGYEDVALWGAGEFAQRLAWDTRFSGKRLVAVVDGSAQRQGLQFAGVAIDKPESLRAIPRVPVVVGSILQSVEIVRAMQQGLHLPNPIITLFRPK